MSDNNSFLANYGSGDTPPPQDTPKTYKYEEQSGFKKPQRQANRPETGGGSNTKRVVIFAAGGVLAVGLAVLLIVLLGGGGVALPDFVGRPLSEVQLWVRANDVLLQTDTAYSDEYEAEKVIAQDKEKGTLIKKGEYVRVTVSLGPDLSVAITLPDLLSMTAQEVEEWATANLMTRVRITAEFSDTVPSGQVIDYQIMDAAQGSTVRRDTTIYVIVSKGPESEAATITVPDFKTKTLAESFAFAAENGIILTVREEFDEYVPAGTLISQSVKAEEKVSKGTEIILVISKGAMITIPDFSGYSREKALGVASSLGIPVTVTERYSGSSAGRFISQSIPAGTQYETGDFLELCYSLGNKIVISSFEGQTRDAIEAWALSLNGQGASITINTKETNSSAAKGTIIHQDKKNASYGIKTTITITVSLGKVTYVPDFISGRFGHYDTALTRERAIAICEEIGLIPIFVQAGSAGVKPGVIWEQSLGIGAEVTQGTTITLKFTPTQTAVVPDFTGMTKAQAQAHFDKLYIVFADAPYDAANEGKVVSQSLTKDTMAVMGSTITLYVVPE